MILSAYQWWINVLCKLKIIMESESSQPFNLDSSAENLPVEDHDEHVSIDSEISKGVELRIVEYDKTIEQSAESLSSGEISVEPRIGMEFNSRDEAREFYVTYGRHAGFTVRIHHNRRSRINNTIIVQNFVCSKEGFREKKHVYGDGKALPPLPSIRTGCPAMLRVALRDGVKWVITKFVKDHNHSLMSPSKVPWRGFGKNSVGQDEKDQQIRELTLELHNERQRCKRRCEVYQEQLRVVLKYVEEHTDHLSRSVQEIVKRVKEVEDDHTDGSD